MNEMTRRALGGPADPHKPGLNPDDAEALLAIDVHLPAPSSEWVAFLGETLSTWLVEQRHPAGVMDESKAQWLIARIDEDGMVRSPGALALLRRCCLRAHTVPAMLLAYLRDQENILRHGETGADSLAQRRLTGV
jgi:hypothetical protein